MAEKKLDEFGGWLMFFYCICWLSIILLAVSFLSLIVNFFKLDFTASGKIVMLIYILDVIITAILIIKMVTMMRSKDSTVPAKITKLITLVLIFSLAFGVCEILVYLLTQGPSGLINFKDSAKAVIKTVVWYVVWTGYWKKSKRVLAYYGKNAS